MSGMKASRWLAVAAVLALAPAPAAADKADALFAKGKAQLAKKEYAEACTTFEQVDALDPAVGAKLNVAKCYQEWGKLVRARKWYADAAKMASSTGDKRAAKIKSLIEEIDPDIPRLTVVVPEGADVGAAAIKLDGESVAEAELGREMRVEPGPHVLTYSVDGKEKTKTIAIERGGAREVTLDLPGGKAAGGGKGKDGPDEAPPQPGRTRRIAGFALMGAGAVSIGIASYLAIDARGDYNSALSMYCMDAKDMCNDEGLRLTGDARSQANLGTVFAIVGVAAAAGGVALYLTAPRAGQAERRSRDFAEDEEAFYLAPVIGDRAGMLVLGGRY
jgi:tetratricopeptide (TPR) repeat protein